MDFQLAKDRPWASEAYWPAFREELRDIPTMLSRHEQKMLHWFGANVEGNGAILDMGTFLGGSTACISQGIAARKDRRRICVDSYDRFRLGKFERNVWFVNRGIPVPKNDNFRHLYDENIKPYCDLVTVHEGDIRKEKWSGSSIEFLFIDLAKKPSVHDHLLRVFFPAMCKNAVLIQQDYLWPGTPWIPVSMKKLYSCFERIVSEPCSVVYRCIRPPTKSEIEKACWENIAPRTRKSLLRRAILEESDPEMAERLNQSLKSKAMEF